MRKLHGRESPSRPSFEKRFSVHTGRRIQVPTTLISCVNPSARGLPEMEMELPSWNEFVQGRDYIATIDGAGLPIAETAIDSSSELPTCNLKHFSMFAE